MGGLEPIVQVREREREREGESERERGRGCVYVCEKNEGRKGRVCVRV